MKQGHHGDGILEEKFFRVGIFGGTFNPIHHGHLIIAEEIREMFDLDRVLFVPSGKPPHKEHQDLAPEEFRYRMVSETVADNPFFAVSDIEMNMEAGSAYTVDTLEKLSLEYGADTLLFFIGGADVLWDLQKWKDPEKLLTSCEFIIAYRSGFDSEGMLCQADAIRERYGARIHLARTLNVEISSSLVKENIRSGKSIKYLVPPCVEAAIAFHGLYK